MIPDHDLGKINKRPLAQAPLLKKRPPSLKFEKAHRALIRRFTVKN